MKDLLKLFKTIMDFKGFPFLVTKQSTIKKLRLLFIWPWLVKLLLQCWNNVCLVTKEDDGEDGR